MSIIRNNILAGASGNQGYEIARSLRFNSADSPILSRTPGSAGNRRKFTCSAWVKKTGILQSLLDVPLLGAGDGTSFGISGTGALGSTYNGRFYIRNGGSNLCKIPNTLFRDPSAWYHFILVIDTENSTAADRQILYVNGSRQENFDGSFTQNTDTNINTTTVHTIGVGVVTSANSSYSGNFLLAEYNFIDGQALTPSDFGETDSNSGAWIPKKYSGTYGTNGFYLKFLDNSGVTATTLGKDSSGNGNNWTPNNFSVSAGTGNDSLEDTPTNNWCTLNPLSRGVDNPSVSDGNLYFSSPSTDHTATATFAIPSSGKWYWEYSKTSGANLMSGIIHSPEAGVLNNFLGGQSNGYSVYASNGNKYNSASGSTYMATPATSTTITIAFDADTNKLYFGADGNWADGSGNTNQTFANAAAAYTVATGYTYFPAISFNGGNAFANFGQRPFDHTPPTGYKALNAANLPVPTVKNGTEYFNTVLFTGNGSTQSITGVGFQPDWTWIKMRSDGTRGHALFDAVRGGTERLDSSATQEGRTNEGNISFQADGFNVTSSHPTVNDSSDTAVAWNWKAGGSGSANTDGTISSTVSVNADAGFSSVSYTGNATTGATVGHGLSVAPNMYIIKDRDSSSNWLVFNDNLATNKNLYLNTTDAEFAAGGFAGMGATSSLIQLPTGGTSTANESGKKYIAYCFSEVEGYSKLGSYTGNGSADGVFIYTGFKPAFVMFKGSSVASNWCILDSTRDTFNVTERTMQANSSAAELTTLSDCDFLSNGIKIRSVVTNDTNVSGQTYIYMAFAKHPFKYANAR